jgi:hypothetical protein
MTQGSPRWCVRARRAHGSPSSWRQSRRHRFSSLHQSALSGRDRSQPKRPARLVMPKATKTRLVRFSSKERGVGRVGAGIAALDIVDAEARRASARWRSCPRARNRCRASAGRRAGSCRTGRFGRIIGKRRSALVAEPAPCRIRTLEPGRLSAGPFESRFTDRHQCQRVGSRSLLAHTAIAHRRGAGRARQPKPHRAALAAAGMGIPAHALPSSGQTPVS